MVVAARGLACAGVLTTLFVSGAVQRASAQPAAAPIQDVAAYYAVVQSNATPVRCKDSERYYKVGELAAGKVVKVDGENANWVRIAYPSSLSAFVRVEEVAVDGKEAKLRTESRLRAANATSGFNGSWQPLLATAAKVGTVLTVIEPVADAAGPVVAYRVVAPGEARGYVEARSVRKATDVEIAAFRTETGAPDLAAVRPDAAAPTAKTPTTPTSATATTATTPAASTAATTPAIDLTKPVTPPSLSPTTLTQGGSNPDTVVPAQQTPRAAPADGTRTPADAALRPTTPDVVVTPRPTARTNSPFERLESSFQSVSKRTAVRVDELDELIGEYEKAIGDEASSRRREGMEARVGFLTLRRDAAETIRRQEEAKALLDSTKVQLNEQLAEVQRSRVYTIVGQIQPSTVYDGRDLPLMYRIISVGGSAPRTLGYLKKNPDFDFDRMLGLVIGVIGETQLDRSLRLNIITPVRVEVLRPGEVGGPLRVETAPTPAATGTDADQSGGDPLDGK